MKTFNGKGELLNTKSMYIPLHDSKLTCFSLLHREQCAEVINLCVVMVGASMMITGVMKTLTVWEARMRLIVVS